MSEPSIFFFEVNERQGVFHRRAFLLGGLTGMGLLALGGRLAQLQLVEAQRYQKLSAGNQFNYRLVPPPRGLIMDRNGVSLASNRPNFRLMINKDKGLEAEAVLDDLSKLVPIDGTRRARILKELDRAPRKAPVVVMEDLSWEEFSRVNIRAPELPNVTADMGEVRVYPFGGAFAHVIGYVAKPNAEDVQAFRDRGADPPAILFNPGFRIGRQGVEKALEDRLRGEPGGNRVEVDARGRVVGEDAENSRPPVPGAEVVLTLDADIQNKALEVFGEESGSCVVMDVRNGDILCMVSAPSFDPNLFVGGVPTAVYRAWADYERRPLLDKAMTGVFAPGSTFKPVTGLAALIAGANPDRRITCNGAYYLGRRFACHATHGSQDMRDAIKNSCNVYFMTLAVEIGPDAIADVARTMGFGQTFDIGIGGQKPGLVPDRDWRRRNPVRGDGKWYPGETPSYGIGQGALTVNALQLAVYTARLANGRKAVQPRLIKSIGGEEQPPAAAVKDLPYDPQMLAVLREGMNRVTDVGGTGARNSQLGLGAVRMAGKTGTAQTRNYGDGARRSNVWTQKDHNLFIAYAPIDEPRYAVSVIVQHGGMGGGTAGAPRAREVMKVALLKDPEIRRRIEQAGFAETEDAGAHDADALGAAAPSPSPSTSTSTGAPQ
jgi:penicillin-binding protein 2